VVLIAWVRVSQVLGGRCGAFRFLQHPGANGRERVVFNPDRGVAVGGAPECKKRWRKKRVAASFSSFISGNPLEDFFPLQHPRRLAGLTPKHLRGTWQGEGAKRRKPVRMCCLGAHGWRHAALGCAKCAQILKKV